MRIAWSAGGCGETDLIPLQKLDHAPSADDSDEDEFLPEEELSGEKNEAMKAFLKWKNASAEDEDDPVCRKVRIVLSADVLMLIALASRFSLHRGRTRNYRSSRVNY